jgi:hypothetical protein
MITGIFTIAALIGIFSRSFNGFLISLFGLFLIIFPIPTISLLISLVVFGFLSSKGKTHAKFKQSAKHHLGGNRDINK